MLCILLTLKAVEQTGFFFNPKLVSEWFTFCIFHFSPFQKKAGGSMYIYSCEYIIQAHKFQGYKMMFLHSR